MNKGIGIGTLGVTVLASLMFQARPRTAPNTPVSKVTAAMATESAAKGEGPWFASCSYWSAARTVNMSGQQTPPVSGTRIDRTQGRRQPNLSPDKDACGTDGWGIPDQANQSTEISVIVATVPDPIHSHLALDFDRAIDAILLAAADNHYLNSYYWLPWRSQISTSGAGDSTAKATKPTEEDMARERQPGLIILRYAPDADNPQRTDHSHFLWESYRRVTYLFLVAETPALGVNGDQLQRAFSYEKLLKDQYGAQLSIRPWSFDRARAVAPQQKASIDNRRVGPMGRPRPIGAIAEEPTAGQQGSLQKSPPGEATRGASAARPGCSNMLSIIGPSYSGSAAGLRTAIDAARPGLGEPCLSISGATSTTVAAQALDPNNENVYVSFGENTTFERTCFLQSLAATGYDLSRVAVLSEAGTVFGANAGKPDSRFHSQNTRGSSQCSRAGVEGNLSGETAILNLRFPRELSLLRNAEANRSSSTAANAPPTPYLDLSLKDQAADDTVQRFSTNQSPLSIEAQLIAIAHQLQSARSQFIIISASNVLDDIFLAQFLHRACPDARLVILSGGDLLFEREGENAPYVGSLSISPYLLSSLDFGDEPQWLHADYQAEEIYNAASFTFRSADSRDMPALAGYRKYPASSGLAQFQQIPLWASAIGVDRYYPLAVLNWCGSDHTDILPTIWSSSNKTLTPKKCAESDLGIPRLGPPNPKDRRNSVPASIDENSGISPSLLWGILACLISLTSIGHCILLAVADLWSPFTRDLAINSNDLPYRRAVYLNIGTSVLAAMAFVTAYPLLRVGHYFSVTDSGRALAWLLLLATVASCIVTAYRTWRYFYHRKCPIYSFFNSMSVVALAGIPMLWSYICKGDNADGYHSYAGLYFSYRCLLPLSGVSPLVPILLLLLAWYLWAVYQTARLRFSQIHRPRIARRTDASSLYNASMNAYPLFVPDNALERCEGSDNCLYANITCLLITREIVWRFLSKSKSNSQRVLGRLAHWLERYIDVVLGLVYLVLFCFCLFAIDIHGVDQFLFKPIFPCRHVLFGLTSCGPTPYELLIKSLFFPLIMIALSGWLRVIFIWGSLNRGLLEPLERMPIRFAFTRYKGATWMSMLRQKGLHIRWRDMGRSTESIRQIVHHPELLNLPALHARLSAQYEVINGHIHELISNMAAGGRKSPVPTSGPVQPVEASAETSVSEGQPARLEMDAETGSHAALPDYDKLFTEELEQARDAETCCPSEHLWDLPRQHDDLCSIFHIEEGYSRFCTLIIDGFLSEEWDQHRSDFVDDVTQPSENSQIASKESKSSGEHPPLVQLAEELIVVRYVALIRAVLINIRYQMLIVGTIFVLALVGWNSYPFQPHAFIDWCFTLLLLTLSLGFVWVFAQMHRSAILSRITNSTANELGREFYLRLITFGSVPVLTWLAYQFPEIGGRLYKIIQPGLQVVK